MLAQVYTHAAGTDWRSGAPIDAEGITLSAAAGITVPTLSFSTSREQSPRPRLDNVTLVIDNNAVETVFTPMTRGTTMLAGDTFNSSSTNAIGALGHLDELVALTGWPHASLSTLATAIAAHLATRTSFTAMTGISAASFEALGLLDTIGRGGSSNPASIDPFGEELISLLGAVSRYAIHGGLPIDWRMAADRVLQAATPLRPARNARVDLVPGRNAGEITEGEDLSIGRLASTVIAGTQAANYVAKVPGIEGRYGVIERVAASGSAEAIVSSLSVDLKTFGVPIGSDQASVERGVPSLWIGDRVRVRDSSGALVPCAILAATLTVLDGGNGVEIQATASEGDWG